jgi:hypothetical protein
MMLSCKETSRLMSEALDRKLAMRERIVLRLHVTVCTACKRVEKQLRFLRRAVSEIPVTDDAPGREQP